MFNAHDVSAKYGNSLFTGGRRESVVEKGRGQLLTDTLFPHSLLGEVVQATAAYEQKKAAAVVKVAHLKRLPEYKGLRRFRHK